MRIKAEWPVRYNLGGSIIPTYEYECEAGHLTTVRDVGLDQAEIACQEVAGVPDFIGDSHPVTLHCCGLVAKRRPFYLDTAVTRLPTRGPIIPPRPAPRSSKNEKPDVWKSMMDEYAYKEHEHAKQYGRGGELADRHDERPTGTRD